MADLRDSFNSNLNPERTEAEVKAQYAAINRGNITTANKQATSQKILANIASGGPIARDTLIIVRMLINFKSNEKIFGDAVKAGTALTDLERYVKFTPTLNVQELMEFVKNRSAFFQRQIPETFKNLLKSLMQNKNNMNALVTANNGPFLVSNGVINNQQLNQQIEQPPPLEKIAKLFDLISQRVPAINPFVVKTINGALQASLIDGPREDFFNSEICQKHLKNLICCFFSGIVSDNPSARQAELRFRNTADKNIINPDKTKQPYKQPTFNEIIDIKKKTVLDEFEKIVNESYTGGNKDQLLKWISNFGKKKLNNKLDVHHPHLWDKFDEDLTTVKQVKETGNRTEIGIIRKNNAMAVYAASRKSVDLSNLSHNSNRFQTWGNAGDLVPDTFSKNLNLNTVGLAMGLDESAFVIFSQGQSLINRIGNSWSNRSYYFMGHKIDFQNPIDLEILELMFEIDPLLYEKKRQGMHASVETGFNQASDYALRIIDPYGKGGPICAFNFAAFSSRVVTYKSEGCWLWKNKYRFYEVIEANVKITVNFPMNYVHKEITNMKHELINHQTVFPDYDPHLPKNTTIRFDF